MKLTLDAVSLFVRDKATAKEFYGRAFGVDSIWEDDVSASVSCPHCGAAQAW